MARLAYLGTPEAAVAPLRALVADGHQIALVVTRPDRRRGRGATLTPSPVKAAAVELGLPVASEVDDVLGAEVELGVVVAFGQLVRPHVLARVPMVNLHFSLLPCWRGAAPVERAILAGDTETGVSLMALDEGLDTGPVYAAARLPVGADESAEELRARLVEAGTHLLVERLRDGVSSLGAPVPQRGTPTYAAKIEPSELHLDWSLPAPWLHRVVRVGRAWTTFRGRRFRVLRARPVPDAEGPPGTLSGLVVTTGEGGLELVEVQAEGKGPTPAIAWRQGARPAPGERLG